MKEKCEEKEEGRSVFERRQNSKRKREILEEGEKERKKKVYRTRRERERERERGEKEKREKAFFDLWRSSRKEKSKEVYF